jgi:hypothetical protein
MIVMIALRAIDAAQIANVGWLDGESDDLPGGQTRPFEEVVQPDPGFSEITPVHLEYLF